MKAKEELQISQMKMVKDSNQGLSIARGYYKYSRYEIKKNKKETKKNYS